jgi:hypothetical protein
MSDSRADAPDVLLLHLDDAARLLDGAGLAFRVVETNAKGKERPCGPLRVIRVRADGRADGLELTVCKM